MLRVLDIAMKVAKEQPYLVELVSYLKYRFIWRRIQIGPQTLWDGVDEKLCELYRSPTSLINVGDIQSIVNSLPPDPWGDEGVQLRVSPFLISRD